MEDPKKTMVKVRLTADIARRRVQELSKDSANLRWTQHIRERMNERGIDSNAVLRILRTGDIEGEPIEGKQAGQWKIKMVRRMQGGRVAGVVSVLVDDSFLRLLTAEWEDLK